MTSIGTPLSPSATRVLFCGGGELGKEVVIELQRYDGEIQLIVRDDGAGFAEMPGGGMGVSSMQERAEAIGGFTRITSQPGQGTEVRTVLPIHQKGGDGAV